MRWLALALSVLSLGACSDRNLPPSGAVDLAGTPPVDLAGADLRGADLAAADLAGDLGQNACVAAAGYCQPGDFVQPMCKMGWHEDKAIEMANPGVCGLGICCVSDDCRASGCASGSYCSGCLGANGAIDYVCIPNGSAC